MGEYDMSSAANDIRVNIANDQDRDYRLTINLTAEEYEGIRAYAKQQGKSMSEQAAQWIIRGLRIAYYLPEYYVRPPRIATPEDD